MILTDEQILDLAHRSVTAYKHVGGIGAMPYRFSAAHMVDAGRAIESAVLATTPKFSPSEPRCVLTGNLCGSDTISQGMLNSGNDCPNGKPCANKRRTDMEVRVRETCQACGGTGKSMPTAEAVLRAEMHNERARMLHSPAYLSMTDFIRCNKCDSTGKTERWAPVAEVQAAAGLPPA